MADNPNKSFTRPNIWLTQSSRTSGRNQTTGPQRAQTSANNRTRFERTASMGNRTRNPRNYTERSPTVPGRTTFSSTTTSNPSDNKSPDVDSGNTDYWGYRPNGANDVFNNYVSNINFMDQEPKRDTSACLPKSVNLGSNVNGEASKKSSPPHIKQGPVGMLPNGSQASAHKNNTQPETASNQKSNNEAPKAEGSNDIIPGTLGRTEFPSYMRPHNNTEIHFGLPPLRRPHCDYTIPTISTLPRPIKGRFSPGSNATGGLPRPTTKQDSEAKSDLPHTVTSGALHEEWANAPEFIPKGSKPKSYAEVVTPKSGKKNSSGKKMCPYLERTGECRLMTTACCPYLHGDICDLCGAAALHPADNNQRKQHHQKCMARHEKEMEVSFAVARSREKTCGICFEVVVEKQIHERRFGILTQCNHCFCLGCIRRWRQARQFENKVVRACPECRVTSDFVCPSVYWVETKEEKDKLIENYKNALAEKQCKYFKQGRGSCPFGNKCFYLHALPDGTKTDVGPPPRRRRNNRNRYPDDGELGDMLQQIILWDFLDEHDHHWLYSFADDIEELVAFFSDSDESESWSEYEFLLD